MPGLQEHLKASKEVWIFAVPTADLQPLSLDHTSSHFIPGPRHLALDAPFEFVYRRRARLAFLGIDEPGPVIDVVNDQDDRLPEHFEDPAGSLVRTVRMASDGNPRLGPGEIAGDSERIRL